MAHGMTRREFAMAASAASVALGFGARARAADAKTLRFIMRDDLRVLDPMWTTAYVTRNHAYMVFDTLFALDDKFNPRPQMVGDYSISADKLFYSFTLRDGLRFHDGQPVHGADCVASLRRWMARDSVGQTLASVTDEISGGDDETFTIRLKEPFPLLLAGLAKVSSLPSFVMPERVAKTDPFQQVTETIGSGPFKFVAAEFQPGHKAVYVKNTDYVPRAEPPSWASGGKVVKVDRVEWLYIPEALTAAQALSAGEVDCWENVPNDSKAALARDRNLTIRSWPGSIGAVRFNHLHPPFDNIKMRQAVLAVADQRDYLYAMAGDQQNWRTCFSYYACDVAEPDEHGGEALSGPRDYDKAKRLIAESGYKGERIVVLDPADIPQLHAEALITNDLLQRLGLNAELATTDWGTVVKRRN